MQDEKNSSRERSERHWLEYSVWRPTQQFVPPTDVIEFPDKVVVVMEIAALRPDNLTINLLEERLVVTGVRERPPLQNAAYHQVEIGFGEFRVEISLQWTLQREGVSATYRDGLLEIDLPRLPESHITVKDGNPKDGESND